MAARCLLLLPMLLAGGLADTDVDGRAALGRGGTEAWLNHCLRHRSYFVTETCETVQPASTAVAAVARLLPSITTSQKILLAPLAAGDVPRQPGGVPRQQGEVPRQAGEDPQKPGGVPQQPGKVPRQPEWGKMEGCASTLASLRGLSLPAAKQLARQLMQSVAAYCIATCSVPGLEEVEWNATTLASDGVRWATVSRLLGAVQRVTRAVLARSDLAYSYNRHFFLSYQYFNQTELQAEMRVFRDYLTSYWKDSVQLLSLGVAHLSKLFIPLGFEHAGIQAEGPQLQGWIKRMENLSEMLHAKLRGWLRDMEFASEQIAYGRLEKAKNLPDRDVIRQPLLRDGLMSYHEHHLSLRGDFGAQCGPRSLQMLGLADAVYSFYHTYWFNRLRYFTTKLALVIDAPSEEWQLADSSGAALSVDTGCLQLLADSLDRPACPLEELPPEAALRRRQCRQQLWQDLVARPPHVPVTSYLAYAQRASVNLCLLAWMAANSLGICHDVPFSMVQSVHDARCYFHSPGNRTCLECSATDAICCVSRAVLLLKCPDFTFQKPPQVCGVTFRADGSSSTTYNVTWRGEGYVKPTDRTLKYQHSLNNATLRYRNFKIDSLKALEFSFITVNILFRFVTAAVYAYLPQLRNLPGKVLLCFHLTGLVQILCSEVVYRMAGVPALSTAVLIDSALTLLGCLWLNVFCYQMYACVRHLRLPNDLPPSEASKIFRRQVLCALTPWSILCAASIVLEKTSKHYLLHSRILFIVGISLSVCFNLVCLGLLRYMYLRTKKSMTQLSIYSSNKFCSRKELVYLTVKTVFLSGVGVIFRIGFHQAQGIAQFVYYVHLATMLQGPLLFVLFICNRTTLPSLRNRILAHWNPDIVGPGQELCSTAETNLARRRKDQSLPSQTSL